MYLYQTVSSITKELTILISSSNNSRKNPSFSLDNFKNLLFTNNLKNLHKGLEFILSDNNENRKQLKIKYFLTHLTFLLKRRTSWSNDFENILLVLISFEFISHSTKANIDFFMNFLTFQLESENMNKEHGLYLVQQLLMNESKFRLHSSVLDQLEYFHEVFYQKEGFEYIDTFNYNDYDLLLDSKYLIIKFVDSYIQRLLFYTDNKSNLILVDEYIVKSNDITSRLRILKILDSFRVLSKFSSQELLPHCYKGTKELRYGKYQIFVVFWKFEPDPDSKLWELFKKNKFFETYLTINHVLKLFHVLYKKKLFLVPHPELFSHQKHSTRIETYKISLFFDIKNNEYNKSLILSGPYSSLLQQELKIQDFQIEKLSVFIVGSLLKNFLKNMQNNINPGEIPEIFINIAECATSAYDTRPSFKEIFKLFKDFNFCKIISAKKPTFKLKFIKYLSEKKELDVELNVSKKLIPNLKLWKNETTGELICGKILEFNIKQESDRNEQIENELKIIIMLNTIQKNKRFFVSFHDFYLGEDKGSTKKMVIRTEYVEHTLKDDQVLDLELDKKLVLSKKILKALCIMHKNYFLHFDIKPENILVDLKSLEIRIIDFDISKGLKLDDSIKNFETTARGTYWYTEPRIRKLKEIDSTKKIKINLSKLDVYSAGLTLFTLLFKDFIVNQEVIDYDSYLITLPDEYLALHNILKGMVAVDESLRSDIFSCYNELKLLLKNSKVKTSPISQNH